jgi:PAS domain S-box-containing protein
MAEKHESKVHVDGTTGTFGESGDLYRLLVDSVQDYAIFALDATGHILTWNAGAQRLKGYTPQEAIGKHFSVFYAPESVRSGFPAFELREAEREGRFEDEGWRFRKDGSRFWASVVITALRDPQGALVGFAKVTRDLTARKMAEEALRESEQRFRLIVTSVRDYAIFMLDPTGHVATWNEGAERIKGYTAGEIIGKHFSQFYPPAKVAEGFPSYELATAARVGRFEDEGWRVKKDGTRFWANVVITALRYEEGRLIGFTKVTRDLTERRAAEEALRESEERFRLLIQGVRDYAIFLLDPDGRVATWNEGAERIKGYDAKDIIGKHFSVFYPKTDVDAGKPEMELEIASATGKYEEEGWRIRKDGTRFWASVVITALRRDGIILGFAKITRDLTERRAAQQRAIEDARRVAAEEAARRAAEERTTELHSLTDALRRQAKELESRTRDAEDARQRADDANRIKSQFLAAMSHELRTPLNAIGGFTDLIDMGLAGPVSAQQHEHLERIRRSQVHLLGIINDILNFSRIEAGQIQYDLEPVPVHEIIGAVAQLIEPQASRKNVRFDHTVCPPDVFMLADRSKVEQIMLNLLSNAIKFTEAKGSIVLSCRWQNRTDVALVVRDTGVGIPNDQLDSIFEPFVQVGRSLSSTAEGTGLGLAISRDLARGMAGDITVTSAVGEGSEFVVTLPRA